MKFIKYLPLFLLFSSATQAMDHAREIDCADKYRQSPLLHAISHGKVEIVRELLERGANPNQIITHTTPLLYAISCGEGANEIVQVLLDNGANPNGTDYRGATALMHASRNGNIEVVRKLLDKGADPNQQDNHGKNALIYLLVGRNIEILRELLRRGANPHQQDNYGKTALAYSLLLGNRVMTYILRNAQSQS